MKWAAIGVVFGLLVGCGGSDNGTNVENPTGTCGVRHDGGRAGYHGPNGSLWVPDCENTLQREYWRAFTDDGTVAYLIPRPDGAPELRGACSDAAADLHGLVDKYALCAPATSIEHVDVINHIDLVDALRITHFLHEQLRFATTGDGRSIQPYPLPSDIVDACNLPGHTNSVELQAICDREKDRLRTGIEIGFTYEGPGAVELAARLNELYGIAN